jgi:hypothetical protein
MSASHATVIPQQGLRCQPELGAISENDIAEVADFIAIQSGKEREAVRSHLAWFLLENPLRRVHDSLGFGLRVDAKLVGCILCSPQAFSCGEKKIVLMGSSSFYVDAAYRGYGGRIFLQYCRLGKQWPLFGTSANPEAAALWRAARAQAISGFEGELFGILRWPPVAEEFAHRRNAGKTLSRLAVNAVSGAARIFRPLRIDTESADSLQLLTQAKQAGKILIGSSSPRVTALRDPSYIRWRYFSGHDGSVAVFAFRSHKSKRDTFVAVNQRTRGYRGQINTLNVLDVYPEASAEEWLRIVGALIARYRTSVDAIVLRGQSSEKQQWFCERGFRARVFEAPIGWLLDRAKLLPTQSWYLVPADGDGLI